MNKKELELLLHKIGWEGFNYCFDGYSNWEDIKDEEFHKLRKNYLKSIREMNSFLENKCKEFNLDYVEILESY